MARGGKDGKRQVERKQDLEAQREAKRAKDAQDKAAGNQLRGEKARTKRSGVRAAAEGGDAGSKAKLKGEAQRKAAAREAEAQRKAAARKAEAQRKAAARKAEAVLAAAEEAVKVDYLTRSTITI